MYYRITEKAMFTLIKDITIITNFFLKYVFVTSTSKMSEVCSFQNAFTKNQTKCK